MYLEIFLADFAVFRVFLRISRDFAEIPEFRGSATARNIRSPEIHKRKIISALWIQRISSKNFWFQNRKELLPWLITGEWNTNSRKRENQQDEWYFRTILPARRSSIFWKHNLTELKCSSPLPWAEIESEGGILAKYFVRSRLEINRTFP